MSEKVTEEYTQGLTKQKKGFSLVWIVPIVAVLITAGMIYKSYMDHGKRIYITIDDGSGIVDGKTPLMYKGIKIGSVKDVHIKKDDVSKIELTVIVDKASAGAVAREGNQFWKVEPKISLTEITGLDTLIQGVYIAVMPAASTKEGLLALDEQTEFVALNRPPVDVFQPGLAIEVNTINKGDISIGAPVLYNQQAIGKVEDKHLSKDRRSINLFLRIDEKYKDLIYKESIFYKIDAVEVKANLQGVKINMGSFASFVAGGIGLYNSDLCLNSAQAKSNAKYVLYDSHDEIQLSEDEIILKMQDDSTLLAGLSKVYYKGIEAGLVKSVKHNPQTDNTIVIIRLNNEFRSFANKKAYFWIVKPSLGFDKVKGLDAIVKGNYINFLSSNIQAPEYSSFTLHSSKPLKDGKHIRLVTYDIASLSEGAGVFYHNIKIGAVSSFVLNKDKLSFNVDVIIKPKYVNLINSSSYFYNNSGVSFKASLQEVVIQTGSIETILRGGISVETFNFKKKSLKRFYVLHDNKNDMLKAKMLLTKGAFITLKAKSSGSIKENSPIYFNQIKVGQILSSTWDSSAQVLVLKAFIEEEYAKEVHLSTLFYNASGIHARIDAGGVKIDTESLETIISGGIAFYTPESTVLKPVKNHTEFTLFDDKEAATNSYFDVKLMAKDSFGLKEGSALSYKNVLLGEVKSIDLVDEDVLLRVRINSKYKKLINADTIFWVEGFSLGLGGVKNPSAIISGPSITLKPGYSKNKAERFMLKGVEPIPHFKEEGLRIVIDAKRLGGIKANTPVYFRQIQVGSVIKQYLNADATGVKIEVFIEPCYAHLVRLNSYFYNASGIGMDISLFGAKVQTETLESIITGGIGFFTPDEVQDEAQEGAEFLLNDDFDEEALTWSPSLQGTKQGCQKL